jgi:hypothetical protein
MLSGENKSHANNENGKSVNIHSTGSNEAVIHSFNRLNVQKNVLVSIYIRNNITL